MAHFQLGSLLIGLVSNWDQFEIALLPNDLPNQKRQAVPQHLYDHVGAELETSRVYVEGETVLSGTGSNFQHIG